MDELSYSALMPPTCLLIIAPAGALIALRWKRIGLAITLGASLLLYASCTPFISTRLLAAVENRTAPATSAELARTQAIVILSGDIHHAKPPAIPVDVGPLTLERLRFAANLYRAHPVPILVTGAALRTDETPAAVLMAKVLEQDFGIKPKWIESKARNTFENATDSAAILKTAGIRTIAVVTQAWHMPRTIWSFDHMGLHAIPAPADRTAIRSQLLPSAGAMIDSFFALHEMLGLAYYRFRHGRT